MTVQMPILGPALPELFLATAAMALLILGVFRKGEEAASRLVGGLAVLCLLLAGALVLGQSGARVTTFNNMFVTDRFAMFAKLLVLGASVLTLLMAQEWMRQEKLGRFEFPVLIVLATLGMLMMISANDLMALYLGLELQSLSLYVVAAYHRDNLRSTEAGLKYFVLGALASGMLLFGASFVYGFTGQTGFEGLARTLGQGAGVSAGAVVGIVFIIAGLAFKVSAVPFHMWTPDVYEGAPTPVTAFFAAAPKMAAAALFVRVMVGPFGGVVAQWQQVVALIAMGSMVLGAFAAINQTNIKRLMAYSSIGHVGYALIGLAVGTSSGVRGILVYLAIYVAMNLGVFAVILSMRRKGQAVEGIDDLAGLSKTHPLMAAGLAALMFSMAGIPPLAGFFGKFYVFIAAIEAHLYTLAVIGVLSSVVGAYYYLRVVKVMYFDEAKEPFDPPLGAAVRLVMVASSAVILLFFLYPAPLLDSAQTAAAALFPG